MRNILHSAFLFTTILAIISCKSTQSGEFDQAGKVAISWELVSNFVGPKDTFEAKFYLKNNGTLTLNDRDWALFFNMAPRPLTGHPTPQPATLEHINGDWYKMTPNKGFRLAPGDSLTVSYRGTEGIVKETDAPLGLYFVFYDKAGKETQIVQLDPCTVVPFTKQEQLLRGSNDEDPILTHEQQYKENLGVSPVSADQLLKVIPTPVKVTPGKGTFTLTASTPIHYQNGLESEAKLLAQRLKELTGSDFAIKNAAPAANTISLQTGKIAVNSISKEAYQLNISDKGISIVGNDAAGVFYGTQSLAALIPTQAFVQKTTSIGLDYVQIEDAPRFHFRSMQLDVSRNFQTKETLLRLLDVLAFYKLNHFLLYTTEDEGWRLEIEGLPELTQVGAQRQHISSYKNAALHPGYGSGPVAYEKGKHGSGFYTKADFIEILKYAAARHIKIIPEVNLPGHAHAAIKAMEARYERLMKEGKEKEANEYRLIDPDDKSVYLSAQGYKDNVVDVTRESTYHFYEKVTDEIIKMYKEAGLTLDLFHIGGDEVAAGAWTQSPLAQELLKKDPSIGNEYNLHPYFIRRLLPRLQKRNLQIHGWEEVSMIKDKEGRLKVNPEFAGKNVIPYVWNNVYDPDMGYRIANAGYPVVLCNVTNFYFDLAYNNDPKEPGLYWAGFVDTRDNYTFAPYDMFKTNYTTAMGKPMVFDKVERLKPEARKNIIGVECQLWSETVKGRDMMEYYTLPKLMGFAESAWSAERPWENIADKTTREKVIQTGWNVFVNTLAQKELPRLSYLNGGYNYRVPLPGAFIENGTLKANVAFPGLTIRYTTDGSEPTQKSAEYKSPIKVSGTLKLKSFDASGKGSRTVIVN
ncbi:family 20 glycosylhydrolase [Runella aurantiaca]|uniref:beta-N-acetylhexosaminidase n=1 Tax=Runella aurantiaca TaxID=2282308 RepID=A0A369I3L3_9BACT|nr:family 20 glycosylhydrolase [Runella aurantiaca]RDB03642.1 beta-N-acetylhexosaminidase [Runella aurantiaca]